MSDTTVLAFDIYGTILDPSSMQAHLADLYPDSAATVTTLWRRYQLEYTWRATCQETYEPFEAITRKALCHALAECSESFDLNAINDLMHHYETLGMFHDVEKTLKKLKANDKYDLYMFSNGSHITLQNARKSHDILKIIFPNDKVISVDDVRAYKPSRTAYNHLLESVGKQKNPGEVILISSNPFDICGAGAMGMRTIWINRTEGGWVDQLGDGPTYEAKTFSDLIKLDSMQS